jgi:hypothetical protein
MTMKLSKLTNFVHSLLFSKTPGLPPVSTEPVVEPCQNQAPVASSSGCEIYQSATAIPGCEVTIYKKGGVEYVQFLKVLRDSSLRSLAFHPMFFNFTLSKTEALANALGVSGAVTQFRLGPKNNIAYFMSVEAFKNLFEKRIALKRGMIHPSRSRPPSVEEKEVAPASTEIERVGAFAALDVPQDVYAAFVESRVGAMFSELMVVAQTIGLQDKEAIIYADRGVLSATGRSVLEIMGLKGVERPECDRRSYTPTELGASMDLSAIGFNKMLEQYGLQIRVRNKWQPTELGLPHCAVFDAYISESETPSNRLQVKWFKSVLTELSRCLDKEAASLEDAA